MSKPSRPISAFTHFAKWAARATGRPGAFIGAVLIIVLWSLTGPIFNFSDTWQLVINTSTTIITFLMVFLIQNTQNRDTEAMQIKLDEDELDRIRAEYEELAKKAREKLQHSRSKMSPAKAKQTR